MTSLEAVFPDAGPSSASAHLRPHLVELIPQEQLRLVLHPVFRYVLTVSLVHARLTAVPSPPKPSVLPAHCEQA